MPPKRVILAPRLRDNQCSQSSLQQCILVECEEDPGCHGSPSPKTGRRPVERYIRTKLLIPSSLTFALTTHTQLPLELSVPMLEVCLAFIILFTLNILFPKRQHYPCSHCGTLWHRTRLDSHGTCDRCFAHLCAEADRFRRRGRCIDALDDGTVDPDDL